MTKIETTPTELENLMVELDVKVWRARFADLYKKYKDSNRGLLYKALLRVDPYYNTADGAKELNAVVYRRGGIKAVARAVKALQTFLENIES